MRKAPGRSPQANHGTERLRRSVPLPNFVWKSPGFPFPRADAPEPAREPTDKTRQTLFETPQSAPKGLSCFLPCYPSIMPSS